MTVWTAPVRYAEVDGQGVVFNAHYLTWCDEAMNAFCVERDLGAGFAEQVRLVSSQLSWTSGAQWRESVSVEVRCTRVGRTSATLTFAIQADGRPSCRVETVYVLVGGDGRPVAIDDVTRDRLAPVS